MNQGIIKSLKVKLRKPLVLKIINQEEQEKESKIPAMDAILMISDVRNDVFTITIRNCFFSAVNDEAEKEKISDYNMDTECYPEKNLQMSSRLTLLFGPLKIRAKKKLSSVL